MAVAFQEVEASLVDIQGVFATLYLAGLAEVLQRSLFAPLYQLSPAQVTLCLPPIRQLG
jgi:hypothetical protein